MSTRQLSSGLAILFLAQWLKANVAVLAFSAIGFWQILNEFRVSALSLLLLLLLLLMHRMILIISKSASKEVVHDRIKYVASFFTSLFTSLLS